MVWVRKTPVQQPQRRHNIANDEPNLGISHSLAFYNHRSLMANRIFLRMSQKLMTSILPDFCALFLLTGRATGRMG